MARPATMIKKLVDSDGDNAARTILDEVPAPPRETSCCRPGCTERFTWRGKGRPPRFCSDTCRYQFSDERDKLQHELDAYEHLLSACFVTWSQSIELSGRVATLKMQLIRYRPF